mgnify:CR=1 FL=1
MNETTKEELTMNAVPKAVNYLKSEINENVGKNLLKILIQGNNSKKNEETLVYLVGANTTVIS